MLTTDSLTHFEKLIWAFWLWGSSSRQLLRTSSLSWKSWSWLVICLWSYFLCFTALLVGFYSGESWLSLSAIKSCDRLLWTESWQWTRAFYLTAGRLQSSPNLSETVLASASVCYWLNLLIADGKARAITCDHFWVKKKFTRSNTLVAC